MDEKVAHWREIMVEDARKKEALKMFWRRNAEKLLRVVLLVALVLIPCLVVKHNTTVKLKKEFEVQLAEAMSQVEQATVDRLAVQYGTVEDAAAKAAMDSEARTLAKMLYAYQHNTDAGLKSACWCALNRVDSKYYPNTVQEVCEQKSQWMGWSEDNPVTQRLYDIAYEQIALWHDGIHAISSEFVYMEWIPSEITLRTNFTGKGHFWYEEDWSKV